MISRKIPTLKVLKNKLGTDQVFDLLEGKEAILVGVIDFDIVELVEIETGIIYIQSTNYVSGLTNLFGRKP